MKEETRGGGFTTWRGRDCRMDEDAAAEAEAEVGEGGSWRRRSRPPDSRQRCTRSASMARRRDGVRRERKGETFVAPPV
jgi:hypothetical protein